MDPDFLAGHPQGDQNQVRIAQLQLMFQVLPLVGREIAMAAEHDLEPGNLLLQPGLKTRHHRRAGSHQGDPPARRRGPLEQGSGQFDARAAAHPVALPPQGPDHAGPVGNHQVGLLHDGAQGPISQRRHGHLGVEGDHLTAAAPMQGKGRRQAIGLDVDGNPQNTAAARGSDRCCHGGGTGSGESMAAVRKNGQI